MLKARAVKSTAKDIFYCGRTKPIKKAKGIFKAIGTKKLEVFIEEEVTWQKEKIF
jgi:hypothetical protein